MNRTFSFLIFCFLATSIAGCGPRSHSDQSQAPWKTFRRDNNGGGDSRFPIKVMEDGYKMVRSYQIGGSKAKNKTVVASRSVLNWEWKMLVQNTSREDMNIEVEYELLDKNDSIIAKSVSREWLRGGEAKTIRRTFLTDIARGNPQDVETSSWNIKTLRS